jgi:hypothetical protein
MTAQAAHSKADSAALPLEEEVQVDELTAFMLTPREEISLDSLYVMLGPWTGDLKGSSEEQVEQSARASEPAATGMLLARSDTQLYRLGASASTTTTATARLTLSAAAASESSARTEAQNLQVTKSDINLKAPASTVYTTATATETSVAQAAAPSARLEIIYLPKVPHLVTKVVDALAEPMWAQESASTTLITTTATERLALSVAAAASTKTEDTTLAKVPHIVAKVLHRWRRRRRGRRHKAC